jgi:energy-converting hydrogenase Eha subunit H
MTYSTNIRLFLTCLLTLLVFSFISCSEQKVSLFEINRLKRDIKIISLNELNIKKNLNTISANQDEGEKTIKVIGLPVDKNTTENK